MTEQNATPADGTPAGVTPTDADQVTDPTMVPFDDDAGGPTADKDPPEAPGGADLDAELGSLS